jgi:hypothetical protein
MLGCSSRTSLRCLVHPATLASIGVLLLNDHVLKRAAPSLLTGKLSDLAGVFFFPFLLAALLSLIVDLWARPRPAVVGLAAIGLTGVWFALAKVSPMVNTATGELTSALLGLPVYIWLDPTDLVALVMLWPAWRLWQKESAHAKQAPPPRIAWVALAIAAMAAVASSPIQEEMVLRVVIDDHEIYALTNAVALVAREDPWDPKLWRTYRTTDNGRSWLVVPETPATMQESLENDPATLVSDPTNPSIKYRLSPEGVVEQSSDGGASWQLVWGVPAGRGKFMARFKQYTPRSWDPGFSYAPGPYDLAFTPDSSGTLIVAMGTEGVLVKDPSGDWVRYPVGRAMPAAAYTYDPLLWVSVLGPELFLSLLIGSLVLVALASYGLQPLLFEIELRQFRSDLRWVRRPAILVGILGGAVSLFLWAFSLLNFPMAVSSAVLFFALGSSLYWTWERALNTMGRPVLARQARRAWLVTMGLLLLAGTVPWILWAVGVVPWHWVAVVIATVSGMLIIAVGAARIHRYTRATPGADAQAGICS